MNYYIGLFLYRYIPKKTASPSSSLPEISYDNAQNEIVNKNVIEAKVPASINEKIFNIKYKIILKQNLVLGI